METQHWAAVCALDVDVSRSEVPTDVAGVVMLIHFLIVVYISGRIDERIQRLQFLWTQEVKTKFSVLMQPVYAVLLYLEQRKLFLNCWEKSGLPVAYRVFRLQKQEVYRFSVYNKF